MVDHLHADRRATIVLPQAARSWVPSPAPGVERQMLERRGRESGLATSVVRYAPGSRFSSHTHVGGEEFLVLEGIFADEHGSYPKGTYVRNPIGSAHAPHVPDGCTIFVKLCQMAPDQDQPRVVRTGWPADPKDLEVVYQDAHERVTVQTLRQPTTLTHPDGIEVLLLEGAAELEGLTLDTYAWLRIAPGDARTLQVPGRAVVLVKEGHLRQ